MTLPRFWILILFFCLFSTAKTQIVFPGLQVGYTYSGVHKPEFGANIYYSRMKKGSPLHVVGPYACLTTVFLHDKAYIGQQFGINYHIMPRKSLMCYRINAAFENNRYGDQRLGADMGVSCLGIYVFAGYYYPVGKMENTAFSPFRAGLRLVFNIGPAGEAYESGSP